MADVVPFPGGNLAGHAIDYARAGLLILPVNPANKTPLISQYQATTDETQLEAWWDTWPDALIGHRVAPEHIILDIDPRHGGHQVLQALRDQLDGFPMTRCHMSGRDDGGGHIWWQRPADKVSVTKLDQWAEQHGLGHEITSRDGRRVRWSAGIDIIQHNHRYSILPPSPHPDTRQPYFWPGSNGIHTPVAALPQLLINLLTDDTPPAPAQAPQPPDPNSIADWYSNTYTWTDLLSRHGWTLVGGDGEHDGSRWRHPTATSAFSATIRHNCLFIYSPNTPFQVTTPGDPHGYTLFAAWALLEHAGNQREAARHARKAKGDSPSSSWDFVGISSNNGEERGEEPTTPVADSPRLPDDLWDARPQLAHIRQAAHSRQRSADAVLHVVLARLAATTPHTIHLPAIVGSPTPLCYFTAIVAQPGTGKSTANRIAAELVPVPDWVVDQVPIGSGEGLIELLFEITEEDDPSGGKQKVKKQTRHNAYVWADEGQILGEIGGRKNAILLPTLRSIWTGETLGQANANRERYRNVAALTYSYGLAAGFQPTKAASLLDDADAGTPQRFGWASANDPTIPDTPPEWPGLVNWQPLPHITGGKPLDIATEIITEVRSNDLGRARGETTIEELDAHNDLYRLKVAALLATLDQRREVTLEDWQLASTIQETSVGVRATVIAAVDYEARQKERRTSALYAHRAADADAAVERRRTIQCATKIREKVTAKPGEWGRSELRRDMRRWRDVFHDGLDHALAEGWIVEKTSQGQGDDRIRLHPGGAP